MAVKIRLARHGKKGYPFYHIVAADSRAPRDGRFIEKIGTFNPNTNPATIELNSDRALYWLTVGALPTDTCRFILSQKGVLLKKHLLEGVKKGALTEEAAIDKLNAWLADKDSKVQNTKVALKQAKSKQESDRLEAEAKVKQAKEAALAQKRVEAAAKAQAETASESAESAETVAEGEAPAEA